MHVVGLFYALAVRLRFQCRDIPVGRGRSAADTQGCESRYRARLLWQLGIEELPRDARRSR